MAASILLFLAALASADPASVDPLILQQLLETARRQQEQLEIQSEQLKKQSISIDLLNRQINSITVSANATPLSTPPVASVVSGNDRIKLSVSGQINRAMNVVSDGGNTRLYHVDNSASGTRLRFVGSARINSDLTLATRLEAAMAPDNSSFVSQTDQTPSDPFNVRWAEISLKSRSLGKLSLGKGDTASKGTAIVDLSRTDLVQYSGIHDIAGGILFREADSSHELTRINVKTAFRNHDGLGRQSRLRYDSPGFMGFNLAASILSDQRSDLALYWGGEGYGFQASGAVAVSNPRIINTGLMYDGSFSVLHRPTGLNLTFSGGFQQYKNRKDATNLYGKLGWIADFTSLGNTAFGLDYTNSGNMPGPDDRGQSVGGAVVQAFDRYATELYLQYRIYRLDRANGPQVDDIQVSTLGVRVKF